MVLAQETVTVDSRVKDDAFSVESDHYTEPLHNCSGTVEPVLCNLSIFLSDNLSPN